MSNQVDPRKYVVIWSRAIPLDIQLDTESDAAREAIAALLCLLYDCPFLQKPISNRQRNRAVRRSCGIFMELCDLYGFTETVKRMKELSHRFLTSFIWVDGVLTMDDFDSKESPVAWLISVVRKSIARGEPDFRLIQWFLTWHVYLSKVALSRPDLSSQTRAAWVKRQEEPIPCVASAFTLDALKKIVSWLFSLEEVELTRGGNHGPGKTAGGYGTVPEKNRAYVPSVPASRLISQHPSYGPHSFTRYNADNEYKEVFKDSGSLRTITEEAPNVQFAQQALKFDIYRLIDAHDSEYPISRYVKFSDQTLTQGLAVRGSLPHGASGVACIDSKDASDRIPNSVIRKIFAGRLGRLIQDGRSSYTRLPGKNGKRIRLNMYGGMGSALTFPVQTIFFCACAIYATIQSLEIRDNGCISDEFPEDLISRYIDANGPKKRFTSYFRSIRIYGDDVCISELAVARLFELLESIGLTVNYAKSFVGDKAVREACGVYALAGQDITPLRYRVPPLPNDALLDARTFESLRAHANLTFRYRYKTLNRYFKHLAKSKKKFEHVTRSYVSRCYKTSDTPFEPHYDEFERFQLYAPSLLFQLDGGPEFFPIGFLSDRESIAHDFHRLSDVVPVLTTYQVETTTKRDKENEDYYLHIDLRNRLFGRTLLEDENPTDEERIASHGSIPSGLRLRRHNVFRFSSLPCDEEQVTPVWCWAT